MPLEELRLLAEVRFEVAAREAAMISSRIAI
jgi:hypothetical protein